MNLATLVATGGRRPAAGRRRAFRQGGSAGTRPDLDGGGVGQRRPDPLAWHGSRTKHVKLGTAVSQLSARPPATLAMTAMTMDHLTGGRVIIGLGAVFARIGYEAAANEILQHYLNGDKAAAVKAVPTKLVEDVALIGPWAKIRDDLQRWAGTVLTTFTVSTDLQHLDKAVALVRGEKP